MLNLACMLLMPSADTQQSDVQGTTADGAGLSVTDEQLHRCWAQAEQALSRMGLSAADDEPSEQQLPGDAPEPHSDLAASVLGAFFRLALAQVCVVALCPMMLLVRRTLAQLQMASVHINQSSSCQESLARGTPAWPPACSAHSSAWSLIWPRYIPLAGIYVAGIHGQLLPAHLRRPGRDGKALDAATLPHSSSLSSHFAFLLLAKVDHPAAGRGDMAGLRASY